MRKLALVFCMTAVLSLSMGCAAVNGAVNKFVPTFDVQAEDMGVGVKIDVGSIVQSICLTSSGAAIGVLDNIPLFGGIAKDLALRVVGSCE
jgi:hypothetical protein